MVSTIYGVYEYGGSNEDRWEILMKTFKDFNKARLYRDDRELEELTNRQIAEKCQKCCEANTSCPFYKEPTYMDQFCGTYEEYAWRVDAFYKIEEIDYEDE